MIDNSDWITTAVAVRITGYNEEYIRRILRAGVVNGKKWGREWMVDRESLLLYMKASEKRGPKSIT